MNTMRIAIIGLGLIGGSLGLALKDAFGHRVEITGIDRCLDSLTEAKDRGAIDTASADAQAAGNQNVVFVCTPVLQMVPVVCEILPHLTDGTLITDVGSTKKYLLDKMKEILPDSLSYIGGHPMAGREKSGILAADKDLFINKWYILSQGINAGPEDYQVLSDLLLATGAKPVTMCATEHDSGAAYMSHIPHVAAAGLVNLLQSGPSQETLLKLMGGGFRDTTRIASSDADMWADICLTNGAAMIEGLTEYRQMIERVICSIAAGDRESLHMFFQEAKEKREYMLKQEV